MVKMQNNVDSRGGSMDEQFGKLHPRFPVETRIGIVGAGPSGVSAAYALARLGYNNVTVLEKHDSAGGMCESVDIEGRIYDLGGQVLAANSAPTIFHLAKEIGAELEDLDTDKFALIDSLGGKLSEMTLVEDYVSMISLTLKLQDEVNTTGKLGVNGVSEIASDLAPSFLSDRGLKSVPKSVSYGYTASGYGYVQDMPYAYVHEFTRTSMAGKIRRFKGGYMNFWHELSQRIPIKFCWNTEVVSIKRTPIGITVNAKDADGDIQVLEFDKIIISGAFPFQNTKTYRAPPSRTLTGPANKYLDLSLLENDLFSKVQTIDYYTTVLGIKGLDHVPKGFYYFREFMDDPATLGNPVAMQRFYSDTNIFLFWSYGNSTDITGPTVTDLAITAVRNMGGEVEKVVLQRRFKYFPHVNSEDMKKGFYEKLEHELQGHCNTYYVGGLMAFELTERNASYSIALVRKHFASDTPDFTYLKRLLPLKSGSSGLISHRQLNELPGVQFPDLPSLNSYLRYWGNHTVTQDKILYTWINERGERVSQRTFRELDDNASIIGHKILTCQNPSINPGDRVLLVYIPGLDFVDAFFGCLRAGVIPVPVIPPDPSQRGGQALLHITNIAKSCSPKAILSTFNYHVGVRAASAKNRLLSHGKCKSTIAWPNCPWLYTDVWIKKSKILAEINKTVDFSVPEPNELCFLQFTSGSTGEAKGVMITHGGLIHNVKMMRKTYKSTSKTVLVSWLPQYHDMGLIGGLFTSLLSGESAVLFSPTTFIKDPLLWLQVMSKYHATHSAGPNFAFELVVRRLESSKVQNLDLSSLIFLMVAAEPIRPGALKRFLELTEPFGLSQEIMAPGYGLAENCVFVSCAYGQEQPIFTDWQGRVCCGYLNENEKDVDIRIVDPETGKENEESDREGEIWICSLSSGVGYWGLQELSETTFRNKLDNHPEKLYLRTGDLGRVIDGKLFITGRIKDLIIIAGRNIYCSDVEKTVESSSKVLRPGCIAAVSVPVEILLSKGFLVPDASDQFGLVVIAEVRDSNSFSEEVIQQIETRVTEEHGVIVSSTVLIKPRSIPKTTSGKIKRFECAKKFIDGTLDVIDEPVKKAGSSIFSTRNSSKPQITKSPPSGNENISKKDITEFLKQLLSEQTGISVAEISTTESLVSYGVDSIGVVRAAQRLSAFLGVPVGAIDIFTATCIDDLANFAESLLFKSLHQSTSSSTEFKHKQMSSAKVVTQASISQKLAIWLAQLIGLAYVCFLLTVPAYISIRMFTFAVSLIQRTSWIGCLSSIAFAPICWVFCMASTCFSIGLLGNSFLQPNYGLYPEISVWSIGFVKWWSLYKAQEVASKVLAVHLRGTVFLNYWFMMLGAKIGTSVVLDTIDITDPYLVAIGEGAVIAEGALLKSTEVKNGTLQLSPIQIGRKSSLGPCAVIQKGSIIEDGAEVLPLQRFGPRTSDSKHASLSISQKGQVMKQSIKDPTGTMSYIQFFGIYMVGCLSTLSAVITYLIYIWLSQKNLSLQEFGFICIVGAFHWLPYTFVAYSAFFSTGHSSPISFAFMVAAGYVAHGIIFSIWTCLLSSYLRRKGVLKQKHLELWFSHRLRVACHVRFTKFITGTEAFVIYLRCLGAKIGHSCSIRAINPVLDPELITIGNGVHLGDFSRIVPGYYNQDGYTRGECEIQDNSVLGSQSLILPGSIIEKDVILGAISIAPMSAVLRSGGVYVGSQAPVMVKNIAYSLDDRIEEMDMKYKKVLGNLAANLAATTLKVNSRYFHRIGVAGKGSLKLYDNIPGLPEHKIFHPGNIYPIIIRHSNCLSSDDDARLDPRGAALRILSNETDKASPLLDLTLKTGNAFHARTIGDFATWLVCGAAAREEHVKNAPHIRDAMWGSLRRANSYAELHYYSNFSRMFRFEDGKEMYVKFKLRPFDEKIDEDSGRVEPSGILPPETGAIPRDQDDNRPLLFLAEDFLRRVNSPEKVRFILQLQIRPVPQEERISEEALDITKPWDQSEYPYVDIGEVIIDEMLSKEESECLEFNPFLRCREVDVIRATSCNQSASMDHGRSIVYEICQHLRNKKPLPEAWKIFLDQSDVKLDLSGCPMASRLRYINSSRVTLARNWYMTLWLMFVQPLLQTFLPYFLMIAAIIIPYNFIQCRINIEKIWLLPFLWLLSGILAAGLCVLTKWILVGKKHDGETEYIWSPSIFMDTAWQATRTLAGDYFLGMSSGSFLFGVLMKCLGSEVAWDQGVYVDSLEALLNPEMIKIEQHGCIEKDALLFGHIYEGEEGRVKYGKIEIEEGGFVGCRAIAMPGVTVKSGGNLAALSLAMKGETVM
ncbi:OLC1v1032491C1 [Oldenlandia corymbosa var. corymbosa]|uniref:OLC1v1032491C1 n=1 Tax=Oldenlandia corymbosa var. corymbosa TaxID=529605 RepID=A0AAV1CLV3_OLDCO|nr:OLC1v1032491C1 [Oldenlandia corymbosa var. corymbosa]